MTTQAKPTIESLGLTATIVSKGIGNMEQNDGPPMLAWLATFTNIRGKSQSFDYFTGSGCGPQPTDSETRTALAGFPGLPKKCDVDCRAALNKAMQNLWRPDPIEILWSIAREGDALEMTFDDWATEFGYDADSRTAEKIYRACQEDALRLRKILSQENIQVLRELGM